jgi:hypothetical protein
MRLLLLTALLIAGCGAENHHSGRVIEPEINHTIGPCNDYNNVLWLNGGSGKYRGYRFLMTAAQLDSVLDIMQRAQWDSTIYYGEAE